MTEPDKPHPIALSHLFFVRSVVVAVPNHDPEQKTISIGPETNISVTKSPDVKGAYEGRMKAVMNLAGDAKYPYIVDMECMAVLNADDTLSEEEAYRGAFITAHSVMYGAIREAVAWITGRQPYGQLMLGLSVLRQSAVPPKAAAEPAP